ncbi:putative membrane protein [Winogradskyella eximia]|mgnify:CR=1 FL=1|jgi:uncharacterized membrane protein|uniref:Putative membrane protein n=1 Tax=Winogradskyella eximia TaxID=262006 RepID=A0A3D9H2D7_9FLAO|nr:DUF1269 domain-containing protein [Winogradskyella eximia]RED43668.1 putative membrane protein [Winogradskyella eximia]|tara:strand:- start:568 stop:1386 length:819 start_codon:yes stop_codon:yes gene_type:complete
MANIIVVSFKEETKAIEALHKIKELDAYGDITLYEHMMIRKKENNHYEVLNDQTDGEGWRTFTGLALGGIIGAFAGPLGLIIGLYTGTAVGAIWDVSRYDFEDNFIKKVSNKMNVGTIAIVAEVAEDSSVFVDDALVGLSSEIIRSEAGLEFDDYVDDQIEDLEEDIDDQRQKLKKATAEEKTKIKAKIADLKAKRKAKIAELETKRKSALKEIKTSTKARINKLESRLESYKDAISDSYSQARKNRLKKRIKREEEKLYQLHSALGEDIVD